MPLVSLQIPAGVYRNGTKLQSKGRWYDCNHIRFKDGRVQPVGGWTQTTLSGIPDSARSMFAWEDNSSKKLLAIGSATKLLVYTGNSGLAYDATPTGFIVGNATATAGIGYGSGAYNGTVVEKTITASDITITNSTTISSTTTDFTQYFSAPDIIQTSGFDTASNNRSYPNGIRVTNVTTNSLTVSGITLTAETPSGDVTLSKSRGFGETITAGTSLVLGANSWSFDNFGEQLIALSKSDGKIYKFLPSYLESTTKAQVLTNAPLQNSAIIVSKERILVALGAGGNPKLVQWCDQESLTNWSPSATNQAGSFEVDTVGTLQVAKKVGDRIVMWTDVDCHALDYIGPPYVFGRRKLGDACGTISPQTVVTARGLSAWMGQGSFWTYDGVVRPLPCEVSSYVFDDLNTIQSSKFFGFANQKFNEIWWFYCSRNSTEIDRYVIWNFVEGWWSIGENPRTAMIDSGVYDYPMGIGTDYKLYEHEIAPVSGIRPQYVSPPDNNEQMCLRDRVLYKGTVEENEQGFVYAETGPYEIGQGERRVQGNQLITDTDAGQNGLRFKFGQQATPEETETFSESYDIQSDGYTDIRINGREVSFKIESPFDQDWDLGNVKMDVKLSGKR